MLLVVRHFFFGCTACKPNSLISRHTCLVFTL